MADLLSDDRCSLVELSLDKCRAKSAKMGLLFQALAQNNSVVNLSLKNMNVPRDSLTAMGDMLGTNKSIQILTLFNAGLADSSVQLLASGLEQKRGLIYLDLRQNTFENDGFSRLVQALTGHVSLLTLRINAVRIEADVLSMLRTLFGHPQCTIQNLQLEELEMSDSRSKDLIDAVSLLKRLFTFNFSNN